MVGTATNHVVSETGHAFQVLAMDAGTFDGVKLAAFASPGPGAGTEYQRDPNPVEVAAAHAAWGLPRVDRP